MDMYGVFRVVDGPNNTPHLKELMSSYTDDLEEARRIRDEFEALSDYRHWFYVAIIDKRSMRFYLVH